MWVKIDDPEPHEELTNPVSCSCSLQFCDFCRVHGGFRSGGNLRTKLLAVVGGDEDENVRIRFRNKHMYTYISIISISATVVQLHPNVCNLSYQTGKSKWCGNAYYFWIDQIYILNIFWGGPGYHIAADHGSCAFRRYLINLKRQTIPCRRHTRKSRNQPRLPQNLCVLIYMYMTSEYKRISFAGIYLKPPSPMHCSHLPELMKLWVNQSAWLCISSIIPHGQGDQDYT